MAGDDPPGGPGEATDDGGATDDAMATDDGGATDAGAAADAGATDGDASTGSGSTAGQLAFLLALLTFVGSAVAYVGLLVTGGDLRLALGVNAAAALAIVALTAHGTYTDPTSAVTSLPGALGTALLMVGVYGLVASVVVATTSLWHDRFDLAIWLGAAAALAAVLGFFTFPAELVGGDGEE